MVRSEAVAFVAKSMGCLDPLRHKVHFEAKVSLKRYQSKGGSNRAGCQRNHPVLPLSCRISQYPFNSDFLASDQADTLC
jgi:hypothetical protein